MNTERWHRIGEIYHAALPRPQSEWTTYVAAACGSDTVLRQEINSLLEADQSSGDFLETSVFEMGLQILMDDNSKSFDTHPAADDPPDRLVGTTIDGRFRIERELGQGGVGAVYLARALKLHDKRVVVKVLLEQSLRNEWVVRKFQQEKEALARVDHPGVVGILDTGDLPDGQPYIVMQYVEGMALRDAVRAKPQGMELGRVATIIKQIGEALSAVHEKKIYHRDLKPENIMLQDLGRGNEQVKIVDFGIAKIKESLVAPSTVTGTPTAGTINYMSPEQLHGDKITAASDIYSFGVIAYEMVTGRRPFNPDTVAQLSDMQREGVRVKPTDLRPRLPEAAQAIILKSLDFDPRARYQGASEFGDALARALTNEEETEVGELTTTELYSAAQPIEPPPASESVAPSESPGAPSQAQHLTGRPEVQKPRWPRLAIALAFAVVLALGSYWFITQRQKLSDSSGESRTGGPKAERSFAYSLTVQKMRDDQPYQEPFQSSGQEIFENGYKFRLNLSSPQPGYLYVFNEGADEKTGMSLTIIYPTPATNKGSARLDANNVMQTNWNKFAGRAGTEEFWIVWSASPVAEMEAAREAAFKNPEGALTDAAMIKTVKDFFTKHSDPMLQTEKDKTKQETYVHGNGELLVKLVELEHR
ncbi:MAG TPA: serine/threonine-protein kinase [Pyrinomonadaceae bacterium]|jgi:serine/threonine protein kinase|nr:serine/threonine-protein kinase [Pyrinomonadaceae bacterium]